jgi:hypothetical protein
VREIHATVSYFGVHFLKGQNGATPTPAAFDATADTLSGSPKFSFQPAVVLRALNRFTVGCRDEGMQAYIDTSGDSNGLHRRHRNTIFDQYASEPFAGTTDDS